MKKYRTWHDRIEEIEIIKETAQYVTEADGQRWAKRNQDFRNYFDTWKEAKDFLRKKKSDELKELYERADRLEDVLQKIEAMQCPQ